MIFNSRGGQTTQKKYLFDILMKTMFSSSVPPVVCRRAHVLFTLFVFVWVQWCPKYIVLCFLGYSIVVSNTYCVMFFGVFYSGVQHILCCVCFVFLPLVYPMLPVSLDCSFLIAPSQFSLKLAHTNILKLHVLVCTII